MPIPADQPQPKTAGELLKVLDGIFGCYCGFTHLGCGPRDQYKAREERAMQAILYYQKHGQDGEETRLAAAAKHLMVAAIALGKCANEGGMSPGWTQWAHNESEKARVASCGCCVETGAITAAEEAAWRRGRDAAAEHLRWIASLAETSQHIADVLRKNASHVDALQPNLHGL